MQTLALNGVSYSRVRWAVGCDPQNRTKLTICDEPTSRPGNVWEKMGDGAF